MRPAGAAAAAAAAGVLLFARRAGAASAVASANEAGITPTPTNYVGMYIGAGSTLSITCNEGATWMTKDGNGQCCRTDVDKCAIGSMCTDLVVELQNGMGAYTCSEGNTCLTMTLYETSPFGGPSITMYGCGKDWTVNTVYRDLDAATTKPSDSSAEPTSAKTSPTTNIPAETSAADGDDGNSPVLDLDPDADKDPDPTDDSKKKSTGSQAWIAGAVVGALAGVALFLGLAFWFGKWRGRQKAKNATGDAAAAGAAPLMRSPPGTAHYNHPHHGPGGMLPPPGSRSHQGTPSTDYTAGSAGYHDTKAYWGGTGSGASAGASPPVVYPAFVSPLMQWQQQQQQQQQGYGPGYGQNQFGGHGAYASPQPSELASPRRPAEMGSDSAPAEMATSPVCRPELPASDEGRRD